MAMEHNVYALPVKAKKGAKKPVQILRVSAPSWVILADALKQTTIELVGDAEWMGVVQKNQKYTLSVDEHGHWTGTFAKAILKKQPKLGKAKHGKTVKGTAKACCKKKNKAVAGKSKPRRKPKALKKS